MTEHDLAGIGVTEALGKTIAQDPKMLEVAVAGIKHYMSQHQRALADDHNGPSIAHSFHLAMDRLIDDARKNPPPISCRKGCAHCCHIEVHCTPDEAELLLYAAKTESIDIDWVRVEHQAKVTKWRQLDYKARRCVFLGADNTCQVYEYRPMTCRKHMVASAPEQCNSQKYPAGDIVVMTANRAEMMASALFSAHGGGSDMLSKQLVKARGKTNEGIS